MTSHPPTPEQQAILSAVKSSKESMMIDAYAGTGKALRNDQLILTPTGYKTIGILTLGDLVIGMDGRAYPVTGVYPQGVRDIFEVKFSDDTCIFADADHIWQTQNTSHRYQNKFVLRTTRELANKPRMPSKGDWGNGTRAYWFFPLCQPVVFGEEKGLPFDPWALGILLGDGSLGEKSVAFASADMQIVEGMRIAVMPYDLSAKYVAQHDYRISRNDISGKSMAGDNKLLTIIRQLNLAGTKSDTKFVPKQYLFGSPRQRLAILQGLMDSDGFAEKSGAEFSSASYELAENVRFIVHSFGGTTSVSVKETTGKLSYRVRIKFPANIPLFRLQRKLNKMGGGQRPNPFRALESITFAGQAEATCISVASPDNMFLTENCVPTHNTSTLVMIANELPSQPAIALAFNTSIKKELERRFSSYWKIMTLNGLGHLAWMRALGRDKKIILDERKLGRLVTAVFKDYQYQGNEDTWGNVRTLVSKAMQVGIVPASRPHKGFRQDTPEQWAMLADENWLVDMGETEIGLAREILARSVAEGFEGTISFDDQIYLSVCFNGQFPRYGLLLGDEVQDWSVMNRVMAQRTCGGRLILVGDPRQSIYSFRGADSDSMTRLRALRTAWIDLPLSVTFRCPKVIVDRQQGHAPGFTAFHSNKIGEVKRFRQYEQQKIGHELVGPLTWNWAKVETLSQSGTIAILCRNNAPLLKIAFKLLRQNTAVTMLGRDIGKTLVALSRKVLPDDEMLAPECVQTVEQWRQSQVALANANGQEEKVANLHDQAECLLAVIEGARAETASAIRWYLKELFERQSGHVVISTIHRAKGLEYDCVLHLDSWRIPSKHAMQNPVQMQQERNLLYVCETRTKRLLIEANLEDFE